jgi:hypothetical protein
MPWRGRCTSKGLQKHVYGHFILSASEFCAPLSTSIIMSNVFTSVLLSTRSAMTPPLCVVVMDFTAATLQVEAAHMLRDLILCVISFDPLHSAYATQLSPTTILRISATFALAGNLFWNKLKCSGSLPRLLFFLMVPLPTSRVDTSSIVLVHFYPSTVFDLKSIFGMPNTGEADAMPTHRM